MQNKDFPLKVVTYIIQTENVHIVHHFVVKLLSYSASPSEITVLILNTKTSI